MKSNRKIIAAVATCTSLTVIAAASILFFHELADRKKIGGRQIRVNYRFSKEFDD